MKIVSVLLATLLLLPSALPWANAQAPGAPPAGAPPAPTPGQLNSSAWARSAGDDRYASSGSGGGFSDRFGGYSGGRSFGGFRR